MRRRTRAGRASLSVVRTAPRDGVADSTAPAEFAVCTTCENISDGVTRTAGDYREAGRQGGAAARDGALTTTFGALGRQLYWLTFALLHCHCISFQRLGELMGEQPALSEDLPQQAPRHPASRSLHSVGTACSEHLLDLFQSHLHRLQELVYTLLEKHAYGSPDRLPLCHPCTHRCAARPVLLSLRLSQAQALAAVVNTWGTQLQRAVVAAAPHPRAARRHLTGT